MCPDNPKAAPVLFKSEQMAILPVVSAQFKTVEMPSVSEMTVRETRKVGA
jgi:hypothetical protein